MTSNIIFAGLQACITDSRLCGHAPAIRKLDKNHFVVNSTGEIKEFKRSEHKDNLSSIRQSVTRFRDIVNANVLKRENCLFVTLTYKRNMTEPKRLWLDMKVFIRRFSSYGMDRYLYCVEPQARGAFHVHLIAIWNEKAPYIKNDIIYKMWGHGFTKTQRIKHVKNIGLYLSSYLTDFGYTDSKGVFHVSKKGGRLSLYPKGMRIYRYSRNILRPVKMSVKPRCRSELNAVLAKYGYKFVSSSSSTVTIGTSGYDLKKSYFVRPEAAVIDSSIYYPSADAITIKPTVGKHYDFYTETDQMHFCRC